MVWLLPHRAPIVLWLSSFLSLVFTLFPLADVGLFSLLGVRLILRVFFQKSLAAQKSGPFREAPLGELPVLKVLGKITGLGLLRSGVGASFASSNSLGLLGLFCFCVLSFRL